MIDERYMQRVLELAKSGMGLVEPNPLVACVIVHDHKIIGEGYHSIFGGAHAEVNAINNVDNLSLLKNSTLYVNLEPCSHFGKTPPCVDLIIKHQIPRVVISNQDPNPSVNGSGIEILKKNNVEVILGILSKEGENLNRRFFTYHRKKRPYVILKWAQSKDGFIDRKRTIDNQQATAISSEPSLLLSHLWRTQEQAILIGKNTALADNPSLTARRVKGRQPLRIVIDREGNLPMSLTLFNDENKTICFNEKRNESNNQISWVKINFENSLNEILNELYKRNIISVIVEGGTYTIDQFIKNNLWDEARVFTSSTELIEGVDAPKINLNAFESKPSGADILTYYFRS